MNQRVLANSLCSDTSGCVSSHGSKQEEENGYAQSHHHNGKASLECLTINDTGNCVVCGKISVCRCERCDDFYCSPQCQITDWPKHRYICFPMPHLIKVSNHFNEPSPMLKANVNSTCKESNREDKKQQSNKLRPTSYIPTSTPLPEDGSTVVVTGFKSSNRCAIRPANKTEEYFKVLIKIDNCGRNAGEMQNIPKPNSYALAQRNDKWCRVQVTSSRSKDQIGIYFTDYGLASFRFLHELKKIPGGVSSLPCYVNMVQLHDVTTYSVDGNILGQLSHLTNEKLKIKFVDPDDKGGNVKLFHIDTNNLVNSEIIKICGSSSTNRREPGSNQPNHHEVGWIQSQHHEPGSRSSNRRESGSNQSNQHEPGSRLSNRKEPGLNLLDHSEPGPSSSNLKEPDMNLSDHSETGSETSNCKEPELDLSDHSEPGSSSSNRKEPDSDLLKLVEAGSSSSKLELNELDANDIADNEVVVKKVTEEPLGNNDSKKHNNEKNAGKCTIDSTTQDNLRGSDKQIDRCMEPPFKIVRFDAKLKNFNAIVVDSSFIGHGLVACILEDDCVNFMAVQMFFAEWKDTKQPYKPKLKEYCMAQFESDWYRAKVVDILDNDRFIVTYIDFSNECEVSSESIRHYPMKLRLPCTTNICAIDGLPMQLSDDLVKYLDKLLTTKKNLLVDGIRAEDNVMFLKCHNLLKDLRLRGLLK